jgi:hypothetical protein
MRYAIIKNGIVDNVIEADQAFADSVGAIPAGNGSIGDLWDGTVYSKPPAPPPVIPQAVTMRQARLALLGAGLLPTITAAIAAMTGTDGEAARIEWEYSGEVQRSTGLVKSMALALGLTDAQLDELFTTAATL